MNYLPLAGGWFYGATLGDERAAYYCSWGLLGDAPTLLIGGWVEQGILGMLI